MRLKMEKPTECIRSRAFGQKGVSASIVYIYRPGLRTNACVVSNHRGEGDGRARCRGDKVLRTVEPVPNPDESFRRLGSPCLYSRQRTSAYRPTGEATVGAIPLHP